MSEKICQYLINKQYIAEEDKELYTYAIFNILSRLAPFLVIIPFCIIINKVLLCTIICYTFMCLRKYSGGYHCKTPFSCFIFSCVIIIGITLLSMYLPYSSITIVVYAISTLISAILAPAKTENRELTHIEKKNYKKRHIANLFIAICLIIISLLINNTYYINSVSITTVIVTIFQII